MNGETPKTGLAMMTEEERNKINNDLLRKSLNTVDASRESLRHLRGRLALTYWIIIGLSVITFVMGIVLLSVPVAAAFGSNIDKFQYLTAAGLGIADLAAIFLFRPIERIHGLMGDMSQILLVLHSFQIQANLRLLEMDITARQSIGQTAEHINEAARDSCTLVQNYFEAKGQAK